MHLQDTNRPARAAASGCEREGGARGGGAREKSTAMYSRSVVYAQEILRSTSYKWLDCQSRVREKLQAGGTTFEESSALFRNSVVYKQPCPWFQRCGETIRQ